MNKIDKFLHQAGAYFGGDGVNYDQFDPRKFAALVRADEREACAKVCEQGLPIASSLSALDDMEMWGEKFAVAIRARGNT